jgi:hypothetical protein
MVSRQTKTSSIWHADIEHGLAHRDHANTCYRNDHDPVPTVGDRPLYLVALVRINVVTSCSISGWSAYGQQCVQTFLEYWPQKEVKLHLVSEDILPSPPPSVWFHDLLSDFDAADFLCRHQDNERAHGQNSIYDLRFDAVKFCKKVFATHTIARIFKTGRLFWMDADCVTRAPVPLELLMRLPPEDCAVAYFARGYYSECGFIGYNLDHPATHPFIAEMARVYASDEVFKEREWHDSWVWDRVRERMKVPAHAIPYRRPTNHPLVHSELGQYMDHRKGKRKKLPVSPEHPIYGKKKK